MRDTEACLEKRYIIYHKKPSGSRTPPWGGSPTGHGRRGLTRSARDYLEGAGLDRGGSAAATGPGRRPARSASGGGALWRSARQREAVCAGSRAVALEARDQVTRRVLFTGLVALLCIGCQEPLRLPYIAPVLHDWPEPYKGTKGLRVHVFTAGSLEVPRSFVTSRGGWFERRKLDVLAFLIEHPTEKLILFNTGLSPQIGRDAAGNLGAVATALGRPRLREGQDLRSQMTEAGFAEEGVARIVVSDLRFYHTGGLERFPSAEVVVSQKEYDAARKGGAFLLHRKADYDHVRRWRFVTYPAHSPLATFPSHLDLLGDGSLVLIDAPGATAGTQALLARLPSRPVLLCGSLAPTEANIRYAAVPLLLFERELWWENLWRLKKLMDLVPGLLATPDHEVALPQGKESEDFVVHAFKEQDGEPGSGEPQP